MTSIFGRILNILGALGLSVLAILPPVMAKSVTDGAAICDISAEAEMRASASSSASTHNLSKVKAGDVSWHVRMKDACAAAKVSHRPVLLFVMLGFLDQEFC